jgi:hypothetical protein
MKTTRTVAAALIGLALMLGAAGAKATTISECQAQISALQTPTQGLTITSRQAEKDRAGLVGKLQSASLELDKAKFCDAIKKLNDYKVKVEALISSGSIEAVEGQELLAGADAAIECITALGVTCS